MKVLAAFHDKGADPYLTSYADGVRSAGVSVEADLEAFWRADPFAYDVVHIQWPETLFDWRIPAADDLAALRQRLREIRGRAKIVYTRHNAHSHLADETTAPVLKELHDLVEAECDGMVHLGEASRAECAVRSDWAVKQHAVIPIPVYDRLYRPYLQMDTAACRRELGIPPGRKVILAFGNFRHEKEKQLVLESFTTWRERRGSFLVAPRWHGGEEFGLSRTRPLLTLKTLGKMAWQRWHGLRLELKRHFPDEEVARFFAAADVVFIQRVGDLNSANIPMAFLFRKVVVGAESGNIGCWIRATGNPIFDPLNMASVHAALREALDLSASGKGEENYRFAMDQWSTGHVGQMHADFYRSVHERR